MRRRTRNQIRTLCIILVSLLALTACAPDIYFLGDPALAAAIANRDKFEAELERAGREHNYAVEVLWDPSEELGTAWLEEQVQRITADALALSPYFSLFANEMSEARPEISLIAFTGQAAGAANLLRVSFDRVEAFQALGEQAARWELAGESRRVSALFLVDTDAAEDEHAALEEGYRAAAEEVLASRVFGAVPDRDTVRRIIRDQIAAGVNGFIVFLGSANRFALELLQTEPVVFATEHAARAPALNDAVMLSLEYPLATGLSAALEAVRDGEHGLVRVRAEVVRGGGYERPQLSESVEANNGESESAE